MNNLSVKSARKGFGSVFTNSVLSSFDQEILTRVNEGSVVYDIGAGEGALAMACAEKGAIVHAIDLSPAPENLPENVTWYRQDLKEFDITSADKADILIFRRVLYFFPYEEAANIIKNYRTLLKDGGSVFCSLIALHSPYAETGYPGNRNIKDRFAIAANENAQKYNLLNPVCMYSEEEARELFQAAGFPKVITGNSGWSVYIAAELN